MPDIMLFREKEEPTKILREEPAQESLHIAVPSYPPLQVLAGEKDALFKRLKKVGFVERIERFITVRAPLDEELKALRSAAVRAQVSTFVAFGETPELHRYRLAAYKRLHPQGVLLARELRKACWGSNYRRHGDMVSLFAIEVLNKDGTIADYPHIHYVCEAREGITTDLVTDLWISIAGEELPDNPVDVQPAPFRAGPDAVVRYVLKEVTPETPADVYPISLLRSQVA